MMKVRANKKAVAACLAVIGAFLALPAVIDNIFVLHMLIMVLFYAYLASSWNIIGGFGGQVSFGHAAFAGISAYFTVLLFTMFGISPWIGMVIGATMAALLSVIISYPCFRLRGTYYSLATIAFAETIRLFVTSTEKIGTIELKGASGLIVSLRGNDALYFQFMSKVPYYYIILNLTIAVIAISYWTKRSRIGFYLAAIRENQDAAEALGVNPQKYKLAAGAISAFLTGIGGAFYAQYVMFIDPATIFGLDLSVSMIIMSVIGGMGTVTGPILGSFFLTPLAELTRMYLGSSYAGAHLVLYGLILMLVIIFMPQGFEPMLVKLYRRAESSKSK